PQRPASCGTWGTTSPFPNVPPGSYTGKTDSDSVAPNLLYSTGWLGDYNGGEGGTEDGTVEGTGRHDGVDIPAVAGTPVFAIAPGRVWLISTTSPGKCSTGFINGRLQCTCPGGTPMSGRYVVVEHRIRTGVGQCVAGTCVGGPRNSLPCG